jgi:hypothetical protein
MLKLLFALITAISATKTLVVCTEAQKTTHSQFLDSLTSRGHKLAFPTKQNSLIQYEALAYQNVVIMSDARFNGPLGMGELVEFVNMGGNVLIATDTMGEALRDFAMEFSVDFAVGPVEDYFAGTEGGWLMPPTVGSPFIVAARDNVLYRGVGHFIGKNEMVQPVPLFD